MLAQAQTLVDTLLKTNARSSKADERNLHALKAEGEAIAALLRRWNAGDALQAAGLLHKFVCDGLIDLDAIGRACGSAVRGLCANYCELTGRPFDSQWAGHPLVQQRVRCFMAAYRDPLLAFLCAASEWQQIQAGMQGKGHLRRSARERTDLVLGPYLDMLGMRAAHVELAQLWETANDPADNNSEDTHQSTAEIIAALTPHLPDAQLLPVEYTLIVAPVRYTQMHNLLAPGGRGGTRSPHMLNIHVLMDDVDGCYRALRWIHDLWMPAEGGVVDMLNAPRISGYRALHTSVVAPLASGKTRVNFVIALRAQYEINLWGAAALHMRDHLQMSTPGAWWNDAATGYTQIATAQPGSLPERLFVFSPQGQLFGFDRGSTVVDFAYHVHSDLAEQCRRFVVNGRPVEPATVLRHLDLVELEHDPRAPGPTRLWLLAAHTSRARNAIERYLKRQGPGIYHGQKILDERLKALEQHYGFNLPPDKVEKAIVDTMRRENFARKEDLLAAVASGQFAADRLFHRLFEREILRLVEIPRSLRLRHHQLHLAQCCRPILGDEIVGNVYRRHGEAVRLTIHRQGCQRIAGHGEVLPTKWRLKPQLVTVARIDLRALDEDGLLGAAIAQVYARQPRVTLHQVRAMARHGSARLQFDLQADQLATIQEIVDALRSLPDYTISEVQSLQLPPSEQAEWQEIVHGTVFNPYSRLPVNEDAMFFGRSQERERILECLATRQPGVWLIGQKRVGKTSLLLHLKEHYLPARNIAPVFVDFQLMGHPARASVFFQVASSVYSSLSSEGRLGEVGAPLRSLFDEDAARRLIEYLTNVQAALGARRLVLLMDEFSRFTDAYLQGELDGSFFDLWRGMMHTTQRANIGYIVVMQQQTCETMVQQLGNNPDDPSWRLMDVGHRLHLRPLEDEDVRRLIEWPMRNHLDYTAEIVDRVAGLVGGSPFLIQAFCHNLVMHMARQQRQQVMPEDVEGVRLEFMQPQEHTFAHMTEMLRGIANHVAGTVARLAVDQGDRQVSWARIRAALPNVAPESLRTALRTMTDQDILLQPAPDRWQFASLLFQQWLALNTE